ncbi:hypothetical protein KIW84_054091 [Lathyrus oleraceus]|uniref:Uncharacterized protein n=1 Tax=Pisum sativum TaxID=3888 RepID=A0A9D4WTF7_PEA|nr:hypothetical protein KIW84_054091 [Pisum sativum]
MKLLLTLPLLVLQSNSLNLNFDAAADEGFGKDFSKSLHRAQQVMKKCVDAKRSLADFRVGDTVFAKLQPYQQHYVPLHQNQMLEFREIANGADSVMQRLTKEETSNLVAAILRRSCL